MAEATTSTPAATTAAPATPKYPDAVLVPSSYKSRAPKDGRQWHRIKSILDIAEPLLGIDRTKGELGYFREIGTRANDPQQSKYLLCSRTKGDDPEFYPKSHANSGQPRFAWTPTADDPLVKVGYLIDPS